jgi:predicted anti-sigma-YlaC factor YlaD
MDGSGELTCRELVELVTDYLEGNLSPQQCMRFEEHLLICDGCSAYLDQVRSTIAVAGSLQEDAIPPHMQERLLTAFRAWKERGSSTKGEPV